MLQQFQLSMPDLHLYIHKWMAHPALLIDESGFLLEANSLFAEKFESGILPGISVYELLEFDEGDRPPWNEAVTGIVHMNLHVKGIPTPRGQSMQSPVRAAVQVLASEEGSRYLIVLEERVVGGLNLLQQFAGTFMKDVNLGVILFDNQFTLVDISDMACRILGLERQSVLNRPMDEVFQDVPNEHRLVQRSILDGVLVRNHAASWTNDRERFELLIDSNLLRDDAGDAVGGYVIFKDVTNLRSLEQQVQRSDRLAMIGQIAAGTAHEIRNPLTSIKGFLQVLHRTFIQTHMEKEQGYTELMLAEIDRINDLVSEFLLLSKPRNVTYDRIDLSSVLRDILPIINNQAVLHNVNIRYQCYYGLPNVVADRELLKQVFINLCKNGIEAMVQGGTLTVTERLDLVEQKVHVDIQDTGPGIPAFLIDKIFDPFFTTKENGTGLGLSVCQRIIHDVGGSIRVSSKGYGTTFTVSLPVCPG